MKYTAEIIGIGKWENPEDIEKIVSDLEKDSEKITELDLSKHSISIKCSEILSKSIEKLKNLTKVIYRDLFIARTIEDLPISLKYLMSALMNKKINFLDLSDNAFGPRTLNSYDFFLKETDSLEYLEIENCGLGPEGSENLAEVLLSNDKIKLKKLTINRNRLENKGAIAISKVFNKMKSLEHIEMFQNGIKKEGMFEIVNSLKENVNLKILKLNDNWLKDEVGKEFANVVKLLTKLKILDLSDLMIGNTNSIEIFKSLAQLNEIEEIYYNYNEVESKKAQKEILNLVVGMKSLKIIELKGNEIKKKLINEYKEQLKDKELKYRDEDEEEEEEEEEEKEEKKNDNDNKTKEKENENKNEANKNENENVNKNENDNENIIKAIVDGINSIDLNK